MLIYIFIYIYISYVNPFIPKLPFLYFSDVFRGWREGALGTNGLISMSLFESGWDSHFLSEALETKNVLNKR